jgi:hypothetical protein
VLVPNLNFQIPDKINDILLCMFTSRSQALPGNAYLKALP